MPVRLPAASWTVDSDAPQRIEQWLVAHLVEVYAFTERSATALVHAGRVLPVVDGLDELDATEQPGYESRAGRALRMFNAYQHYRAKADLIVTCRSGHYEALTNDQAWVRDAARIELRPVDAKQAARFIADRADDPERWQEVLRTIGDDRRGPLAVGLDTPWRLTLAVTVYDERGDDTAFVRNPDDLTESGLDTPAAVRDHLLGLFVPAALHTVPDQPYRPAEVRHWLTVLASYLERNSAEQRTLGGRPLSGTDIAAHELWPLAGPRRARAVHFSLVPMFWLVGLPIILTRVPIGFSLRQIIGAAVPIIAVVAASSSAWSTLWLQPHRLNFVRFWRQLGRRDLLPDLIVGVLGGLGTGLFATLIGTLTVDFASGLTAGTAVLLPVALTVIFARRLTESADIGASDPKSVIVNDFLAGFTFALTSVLVGGLGFAYLSSVIDALGLNAVFLAVAVVLVGGTALAGFSPAVLRYLALLLCTRRRSGHWLPWRLGRFLDVCYRAGLLRIAGNGYQFRHRELQQYLAPAVSPGSIPGIPAVRATNTRWEMTTMSFGDKVEHKAEEVKGEAKESWGTATGDPDLRAEGRADQDEANVKQAGDKVKDAAHDVKDALS